MSKNFEILKGLFGDQITELEESQRDLLSGKLDTLLETRVDAKVKFQTEVIEEEAKEKYDTLLKEATNKYSTNLKLVEESAFSKCKAHKEKIEEEVKIAVKQIKEQKEKEVAQHKKVMTEKLDKYLNYELAKRIPDTYVEEAAKSAIYEPMVTGFKKIMEENGINLNEENFGIVRNAREEITKIREELAEAVKENMEIVSENHDMKRSMKFSEVCNGLTPDQCERASKLLEGCDADELETKFHAIRDYIIESVDEKKEEEEEDKKKEKKVEESEESGALADVGGDLEENEKPESEEDVTNMPDAKEDEVVNEEAQMQQWKTLFKEQIGLK